MGTNMGREMMKMYKEWTSGKNCPYCNVELVKHEDQEDQFYITSEKCPICNKVFKTNELTGEVHVNDQ